MEKKGKPDEDMLLPKHSKAFYEQKDNGLGRKSNILLVTTDQQRTDALGCYGSTFAISPNLDRLASEGVLYTDAYSASPVCMAYRACLLTGVHPPVNGLIENSTGSRNPDLTTFTDLLKEQGYKNIIVGKTHFGSIPDSVTVYDDGHNGDDGAEGKNKETRADDGRAERAIAEMGKIAGSGEKFFMHLSLLAPHGPILPPPEWLDKYKDVKFPDINYTPGEEQKLPGMLKHMYNIKEDTVIDTGLEKIHEKRKAYYAYSSYADEQIGKVLKYLDDSGLRENTLVIYTVDHGNELNDHGINGSKHDFFDAAWRVPLIISMPGTIPSGEKRDFAVTTDVTATILGAAGIKSYTVQGFDLIPSLLSGEQSPRRCGVGTIYKSAALATRDWKIAYYFEDCFTMLFNLKKDPKEQINLADDERYKGIKNQLLNALLIWRSDIMDVETLFKNTKAGGGPVAKRLYSRTMSIRGTDPEERLNKAVEKLDVSD